MELNQTHPWKATSQVSMDGWKRQFILMELNQNHPWNATSQASMDSTHQIYLI
jgi:hypothetical protein